LSISLAVARRTVWPMSWAFVHFLRCTTPARRLLFGRILEALRRGESNAEAVRGALRGQAIAELDRELREHLAVLQRRLPGSAPR
jgi:hypothetical protein